MGVEVYVNDLSSQATDIFVTFGKFIAKCRNHKTQTETLKKFVYRYVKAFNYYLVKLDKNEKWNIR